MTDTRRTIKIPDDEFQMLKADKPDGVSWAYYLTEIRTVDND